MKSVRAIAVLLLLVMGVPSLAEKADDGAVEEISDKATEAKDQSQCTKCERDNISGGTWNGMSPWEVMNLANQLSGDTGKEQASPAG